MTLAYGDFGDVQHLSYFAKGKAIVKGFDHLLLPLRQETNELCKVEVGFVGIVRSRNGRIELPKGDETARLVGVLSFDVKQSAIGHTARPGLTAF